MVKSKQDLLSIASDEPWPSMQMPKIASRVVIISQRPQRTISIKTRHHNHHNSSAQLTWPPVFLPCLARQHFSVVPVIQPLRPVAQVTMLAAELTQIISKSSRVKAENMWHHPKLSNKTVYSQELPTYSRYPGQVPHRRIKEAAPPIWTLTLWT